MLFLAKSNFKAHKKQYTATSIALIICCVFTIFAISTVNLLDWSFVRGNIKYSNVDLILSGDYAGSDTVDVNYSEKIKAASKYWGSDDGTLQADFPEFEQIHAYYEFYTHVKTDDAELSCRLSGFLPQPFYQPQLLTGSVPQAPDDLIISSGLAKQLNVKIGDKLLFANNFDSEGEQSLSFKVSGIIKEDIRFKLGRVPEVYISDAGIKRYLGDVDSGAGADYLIKLKDGSDVATSIQKIRNKIELDGMLQILGVKSVLEEIETSASDSSAFKAIISICIYIFPLLASLFCITVVAATFNVVFVRRRKEIGLMRCVGAACGQIRRLTFSECLAVGVLSSLAGCILGVILSVVIIMLSGMMATPASVFELFNIWTFLIPLACGILITVIAGVKPTMRISKTAPLAAFQEETVSKQRRSLHSVFRFTFALLLTVAALFLWKIIWPLRTSKDYYEVQFAFVLLVAGGLLIMAAILLVGSYLLPRLVALLCRPFNRYPIVRMTALNILSNGKRSGSTITMLLLGIIIVSTIALGTMSIDATINRGMRREYPIDLHLQVEYNGKPLNDEQIAKVVQTTGALKYAIGKSYTGITGMSDAAGNYIDLSSMQTYGQNNGIGDLKLRVLPENIADFSNTYNIQSVGAEELWIAEDCDLGRLLVRYNGQYITLHYPDGSSGKYLLKVFDLPSYLDVGWRNRVYTAGERMPELEAAALQVEADNLLLKMPESENMMSLQEQVNKIVANLGNQYDFEGSYVTYAYIKIFLNAALLVLVTLTCVSALVAVVGIANNLSLAVIDRTRDNALLRAVGMSAGQIKKMVIFEGFLMGFAALLGGLAVSAGFVIFGINVLPFGSKLIDSDRIVYMPLWYIPLLLFIVAVSCFLSTYLPAKKAAQASPVEALNNAD